MTATDPKTPQTWVWSLSQRRALIALLAVFFVALCIRYALNRQYVPDPQPTHGWRYNELASQIDPNTADWQTLAAVPGLGEKRAKEIVAYRDRVRTSKPDAVAFHVPADLRHVRGIGNATISNLRPYLIFPSDHPATEP
jgi:hypothetical protein